jgi:phage terminase large subunit-like protein
VSAWTLPHRMAGLDAFRISLRASDGPDVSRYDWQARARPEQREPEEYATWMLLGGRGSGKTRTAAETLRAWAAARPGHYAVVAASLRECAKICIGVDRSGPSSLTTVIPPGEQVRCGSQLSDLYLELANGTTIRGFGAKTPDALRGYAFDGFWCDELVAWPKRTAQDVLDMAWFCMRESTHPRMVIATTPKNIRVIKDLVDASTTDPQIIITRASTYANAANLSKVALDRLKAKYAGTRAGRQELDGELLEDVEGALWTQDVVESCRWEGALPELSRVVVSVDPSGSENGDATGIVVAASTPSGVVYVLADHTTSGTVTHRYAEVVRAVVEHSAGTVLYEGNYGGDNIAAAIRTALRAARATAELDPDSDQRILGLNPRILKSTARGTKTDRATSVVGLFEQTAGATDQARGSIWLTAPFPVLETEMTTWEPDSGESPNALDAMVHAVRHLTDRKTPPSTATVAHRHRIERGGPIGPARPGR